MAVQAEHVVPGCAGEGDGVAIGELERVAECPEVEGQHRQRPHHGAGAVGGPAADPVVQARSAVADRLARECIAEQDDTDQPGLEFECDGEPGQEAGESHHPPARRAIPLLHQHTERREGEARRDHVREEFAREGHHHRREAQGDRGGGAVTGQEAVRRPAHQQEQEDRGDHRREQGEGPDDRRRVLHETLNVEPSLHVVPVILQRDDAGGLIPLWMGRMGRVADSGARELVTAEVVDRHVERGAERGHAGALDRVEVAVDPGLVIRVPVPPVDLRLALGEGLHLVVVSHLRPAHLVHDEAPRDAEGDDRGDSRA